MSGCLGSGAVGGTLLELLDLHEFPALLASARLVMVTQTLEATSWVSACSNVVTVLDLDQDSSECCPAHKLQILDACWTRKIFKHVEALLLSLSDSLSEVECQGERNKSKVQRRELFE